MPLVLSLFLIFVARFYISFVTAANTVRIPRRWQQLSRDGEKARQALTAELGRQPNEQEIAAALCVDLTEWRSVKLASSNRVPLSLNARVPSSSHQQADSAMTLGDTLMDIRSTILQGNEEERIEPAARPQPA